ncbi:hypothetical protein BD410DRAFT_371758 [Rickenella mellea]|uniref:Uncharacterized protein n=1 Tax=Rickenella mellea TaxID=50990 RepID=A0A4Y7PZE4_9AGAM|nr:hypothetical protein BD410DRAFT_371758 [Rickenella mellea]
MWDHWPYLRQQVLPKILGALRIANPDCQVEIFWKTTAISSKDRQSTPKESRQFNDFPDIEIIDHPQNKLSPYFIQQSVDSFVSSAERGVPVTRHLFIAAVSSIAEAVPLNAQLHYPSDPDTQWDLLTSKVVEAGIILHTITNPAVNVRRLIDLYQNTIRFGDRIEVVPWGSENSAQCVCRLSSSRNASVMHLPHSSNFDVTNGLPTLSRVYSDTASNPTPRESRPGVLPRNNSFPLSTHAMERWPGVSDGSPSRGQALDIPAPSLVSRLQAIHNLTKRKPDNNVGPRPSFFREPSPVADAVASTSATRPIRTRRMTTTLPALDVHPRSDDSPAASRKKRRTNRRVSPLATTLPAPRGSSRIATASIVRFPNSSESDSSIPSSPTSMWSPDSVPSASPLNSSNGPLTMDSPIPHSPIAPPNSAPGQLQSAIHEIQSPIDMQMMSLSAQQPYPSRDRLPSSLGSQPVASIGNTAYVPDGGIAYGEASSGATCDHPPQAGLVADAASAELITTAVPTLSSAIPVDGHAPFIIDSAFEERLTQRVRRAHQSLLLQQSSPSLVSTQPLGAAYPMPTADTSNHNGLIYTSVGNNVDQSGYPMAAYQNPNLFAPTMHGT